MEVRGISNNPLFVKSPQNKKGDSVHPQDQKDKIQISTEARDLAKTDLTPQRLEEIRSKLNSKFYDSDEVLKKVVEKILPEVTK